MTVQTTLASLSTTAASNGPDGASDPPSALDDALRYHGAFIAQLRDALMPVGSIVAYHGLLSDLPTNWKVCDGTNGTPDLRDRFIIGVSSAKPSGATGGSANAIVVAHQHTYSGATGTESALHSHGVNDPTHTHLWGNNNQNATAAGAGSLGGSGAGTASATSASATGISLGTESALHTHSYSGATTVTGAVGTDANLPPYYALVYIRRNA